ncbi:glycosyltransferase [Kitasatospora purpeofusca]|uniref:glycosyltransferase n=1 Tax=Kitasatospora purpeofusca TaxID=67352 RepID=UPI002E0F7A42|nr:glycosyltransferase [Kitasatospora purpeofusca]
MNPVDTASFRPRALRAEERSRLLARTVQVPGQRGEPVALPALWTKEAQLRPIVVTAVAEAEQPVLPALLDVFAQVQLRLPENLSPVLLVAGAGAMPAASSYSDDVFLVRQQEPEGWPVLLAAADLFLATSPDASQAVYEAMSTGLPVIGTTGGSLEKDVTTGGHEANGWLADEGDTGALVSAFVQACLYRPERLRRGTAAAEYVRASLRVRGPRSAAGCPPQLPVDAA